MIHSEASPEELPEEVSDLEASGKSSSSAIATDPSRLACGLEDEGIVICAAEFKVNLSRFMSGQRWSGAILIIFSSKPLVNVLIEFLKIRFAELLLVENFQSNFHKRFLVFCCNHMHNFCSVVDSIKFSSQMFFLLVFFSHMP